MAEAQSSEEKITISIKDQSDESLFFRIRRDAQVMNMLRKYCQEKQLDYKTVNFFLDGIRLRRRGTAHQVGLKNGDEIDVFVHASGGGPGPGPSY